MTEREVVDISRRREPETPRTRRRRRTATIVRFTLLSILFFFIGRYIYLHLHELDPETLSFNLPLLAAALLLSAAATVGNAFVWQHVTRKNHCAIRLWLGILVWFRAELGKYIPTKILLVAGKLYFYHRERQSKRAIIVSIYLEALCILFAQAILFLVALTISGVTFLTDYRTVVLCLVPLFFIFVHPRVIQIALNFVLRILRRSPSNLAIRYFDILGITTLHIVINIGLGIGFFLLVRAFHPLPLQDAVYLTGVLALASCLGSLSFITPSGLGVREGVLILGLQSIVPEPVAALAALLARLWASGPELLLILAAYAWPVGARRGPAPTAPLTSPVAPASPSREPAKP